MSAGTTVRTVRVDPDLWDAAMAAAAVNGETVSDVIRDALTRYTRSAQFAADLTTPEDPA